MNSPTSRALGIINETERIPANLLTSFQLEDYAEALAEVGRWEDAAKLDTPKKGYYAQVVDAIYLDDSYTCDCPEFNGTAKVAQDPSDPNSSLVQKPVIFPTWFVVREITSPVHGKARLYKCNRCFDLNVKA